MMTDLAPPQIRGITGLELAAGVFTKCSDQLATQLQISLTSGKRDSGPMPLRIGINGDVYGGMRAPEEVGMRRVDIAYVNPAALVAMAYRGKGYYKKKLELRVLGCFPSWDRSSGVHCFAVLGMNVPGVFQSETSIDRSPPTSPPP